MFRTDAGPLSEIFSRWPVFTNGPSCYWWWLIKFYFGMFDAVLLGFCMDPYKYSLLYGQFINFSIPFLLLVLSTFMSITNWMLNCVLIILSAQRNVKNRKRWTINPCNNTYLPTLNFIKVGYIKYCDIIDRTLSKIQN